MLRNKKGFSLLELLIVISIVAVLGTVGVGFYLNYAKNVEIKTVANTLVSDLKQTQAKSMAGVGGLKWGVHLVNGDTDYYETFSSPSDYSDAAKNIISTNYLSSGVSFSDPTIGVSKDIIFNKISGGITDASIIKLISSDIIKTINISSIGNISIVENGSIVIPIEVPLVSVGDSYQGGIVAYILQVGDPGYNANVQHGIIASLTDLSTSEYWHATNDGTTGATGTAIGTGLGNTNTIVATYGAESNAAKLTYDYTNSDTGTGIYTDWYLPSIDEFYKLYLNRVLVGGFAAGSYWSSSEDNLTTAWYQGFGSGTQYTYGKSLAIGVRAVRSF